jgi:3D (Asp-Asp-Asp) domain-containing protein
MRYPASKTAVLLNGSRMTASTNPPSANRRFRSLITLTVVALIAPFSHAAGRTQPTAPASKMVDVVRPSAANTVVDEDQAEAVPAAAKSPELLRPIAVPVAPAKVTKLKILRLLVTAYCPCTKCCGPNAQGLTASGRPISYNKGRFVAADTDLLPFGTKLVIPGYHDAQPVEVQDRGGAIKGRHIDVYFSSHQKALEWGKQWLDVTVAE